MSIFKFKSKNQKSKFPKVKKLSEKELNLITGGAGSTTLSDATPIRAVMNG